MSRTYTRQEMYDLVWSKALRLLCADFNVSDVALKKACRKADVPTPPVGYWNKLQAGKRVTQIPLPRRGLGMSDSVPVGSARWEYGRRDALDPLPPEPVFDGDESDVRARAVKLVGKVAIPRDFTRASPIVRQLLDEDERRLEEARKNRYYWQTPRYVLPIDRRRLRLANGLLLGIASAGGRAHLSDKDALTFSVVVGDQSVGLSIDKVVTRSRAVRGQPAPDPVETIEISISGWGYKDGKLHLWKDEPDAKLESLATEIVVAVFADGELRHRHHVIDHHKHLVAWRAEEIENRRKAKIEAERKERERQERLAKRARGKASWGCRGLPQGYGHPCLRCRGAGRFSCRHRSRCHRGEAAVSSGSGRPDRSCRQPELRCAFGRPAGQRAHTGGRWTGRPGVTGVTAVSAVTRQAASFAGAWPGTI